jgi:hypothetical protein
VLLPLLRPDGDRDVRADAAVLGKEARHRVSKKHAPAKSAGGTQHGGRQAATVGKPAQHHKPAKAAPGKAAGHHPAGKHAGAVASKKHQGAAASKKHHPKRGWSAGDVECCAAEALAASLRLAGQPVTDAEVLALYWATASGPDAGASIWETLWATAEFGLAGVRPANIQVFGPELGSSAAAFKFPLILGVDWPAPHAVLATGDGWWSWGELHEPFPGATIQEAWAVTWQ